MVILSFDPFADIDTQTPISISYIQQPGIRGNEILSGFVTTDETYHELTKDGTLQYNKLHSGFMAVGQDEHTMAIHFSWCDVYMLLKKI